MKSYNITFKVNNLVIPVAYHYELQSFLYNIIRKGGESELHDKNEEIKNFKFFTFGLLYGGQVKENKMIFSHEMKLIVRILDEEVSNAFDNGLKQELNFFHNKIEILSLKTRVFNFISSKYLIKTLSPIDVDRTVDDIRIYYSPKNKRFEELINENLKAKYFAYYHEELKDNICLQFVGNMKKYITLYKKSPNIYITGYHGYFVIFGDPKLIEFLYYTGLGARNSCGFGAFEIVEAL